MKNILVAFILIIGIVSVAFYSEQKKTADPVIASKSLAQVAIVVKDIDAARNAWAQLLGIKIPEVSIAESNAARPTLYMGKSSAKVPGRNILINMEKAYIILPSR
jgi:hypothetical protein